MAQKQSQQRTPWKDTKEAKDYEKRKKQQAQDRRNG